MKTEFKTRTLLKNRVCMEYERINGAYRDRTDDPLLAKQMLSQLS